jgi:hypothetical protein
LLLINVKEVFGEADVTGFTGIVPFVCSIESDDQIKEMSYIPMDAFQSRLSGLDQSLTIAGNSNVIITAELISQVSSIPSTIQRTSTTLFENGRPQLYVNGGVNPVDLKEGSIPLWVLLDVFVNPTPADYEFEVLITCTQN